MRAGHDLAGPEHEGQGRVLEDDGVLVGPAGDGQAQGLGQDDGPDGQGVGHAQGAGGLELPLGQGQDGPAENLRLIGPAGHAQHDGRGGHGVQIQADEVEQAEIEEKKEHQDGHAAEKPDVGVADEAHGPAAVDLPHGQRNADEKTQEHGADHRGDGDGGALQHEGQGVEEDGQGFVHVRDGSFKVWRRQKNGKAGTIPGLPMDSHGAGPTC